MNTGDSLLALSVDVEDNHGGFGFGLYSPRVARSVSNISTASSSPSDDRMSYDSQDRLSELDNASETVLGILAQSPCSNHVNTPRSLAMPKELIVAHSSHQGEGRVHPRERHASTGKENHLNSPNANIDMSHRHETPNSKVHKSALDVYNFESNTPKKDEMDTGEYYEVVHETPSSSQSGRVRATLSFSAYQQTASMGPSAEEYSLFQGDSLDSEILDDLDDDKAQADVFQKPVDFLRIQTRDSLGASGSTPNRMLPGLTLIPPENLPLSKTLSISPGYGKFDGTGSSTCSSCVSSPIILQSDSQCFTYSVRRYVEYFGRPDSPVDVEGKMLGE